ncbi:MAG: zinc-binding dehydrogenase [Microlunatus sp.]|nr:zinc-binding dehydrogenase [Microlunatus sp.]
MVRDGGRLIAVSGDRLISERGVQVGTVPYDVDVRDDVAQLLKQIAARELRVEIERVYPFAEAPAALAKVQTRHARGKIVLRLE